VRWDGGIGGVPVTWDHGIPTSKKRRGAQKEKAEEKKELYLKKTTLGGLEDANKRRTAGRCTKKKEVPGNSVGSGSRKGKRSSQESKHTVTPHVVEESITEVMFLSNRNIDTKISKQTKLCG